MSLLFKPNKKNRKKLHKFQVGGTIPVYASYQFKPAPVAPFDPSALLQKYAAPAAAKETKAEAKIPELKAPDTIGLPSDAIVTNQMANEIYGIIQEGLTTIPGFETTPYFTKLSQEYQQIVTLGNNKNKQEQALFEKNSELMVSQGGQNSLYFRNKRYLALDQEGKYQLVTAKEVRESNGTLSPMTYGQVAEARFNDPSLANQTDITMSMADAMDYNYFRKTYLDPAFNGLGSDKSSWKTSGGGQILEDATILKSFVQGGSRDDNSVQVQNAFKSIMDNLDVKAKNYLESRARGFVIGTDEDGNFKYPETDTEIKQTIEKLLAAEWMKRLNISTTSETGQTFDLEATENFSKTGSITGSTKYEIGDPMADIINPDSFQIGLTESDKKLYNNKNMIVRYLYADASNMALNIESDKLLSEQVDGSKDKGQKFHVATKIKEAQLADGRLLSQIEGKDGYDNKLTLLDIGYIDKSKGLTLAYVPLGPDGAVLAESKLKDPEGYKKKVAELEKKYKNNQTQLSIELDKLIPKHLPDGGRIKIMYQATLVYADRFFDEDPVKKSAQFTSTANTDKYVKALGEQLANSFWNNIEAGEETIKSTVVLIPMAERDKVQLVSGGVYIGKQAVSLNSLVEGMGASKTRETNLYTTNKAQLTNTAELQKNIQ